MHSQNSHYHQLLSTLIWKYPVGPGIYLALVNNDFSKGNCTSQCRRVGTSILKIMAFTKKPWYTVWSLRICMYHIMMIVTPTNGFHHISTLYLQYVYPSHMPDWLLNGLAFHHWTRSHMPIWHQAQETKLIKHMPCDRMTHILACALIACSMSGVERYMAGLLGN